MCLTFLFVIWPPPSVPEARCNLVFIGFSCSVARLFSALSGYFLSLDCLSWAITSRACAVFFFFSRFIRCLWFCPARFLIVLFFSRSVGEFTRSTPRPIPPFFEVASKTSVEALWSFYPPLAPFPSLPKAHRFCLLLCNLPRELWYVPYTAGLCSPPLYVRSNSGSQRLLCVSYPPIPFFSPLHRHRVRNFDGPPAKTRPHVLFYFFDESPH